MDQGMNGRHSETNGTILGRNWPQSLESVYFSIGPLFSWTLIATGTVGTTGNILTLLVYSRLGFSSTIYISYTALAVSDLFCVLSSMVFGLRYMRSPLPNLSAQVSDEVLRLVGVYPHFAFSRTTGLLTAWISLERCLCVIFPTRVKLMISRTVTKLTIIAIFLIGCFPLVFLYGVYRIERQFDPNSNATSFTFLRHGGPLQEKLESTALFLFSVVYPTLSCVSVTVCTVALIIKLRHSTRWRKLNATAANAQQGKSSSQNAQTSTRETRVTRVVIIVAGVFLICSLPTAAHLLAVATIDGYSNTGYLRYLRWINGMVTVLFAQVNSSLNIVIFATSGQRFRAVLFQILTGCVYTRSSHGKDQHL
ncbi:chemosensory receptor A [Elysia marginata]|uniref:Chemosensory receptor A n=1 Tax=Elysia marginata TaxID=1093978 RepID=A0AAV4HXB0_9GAST|nr:chemosensory receptor A [Elysia marginata]